jgi:hypothetical protein
VFSENQSDVDSTLPPNGHGESYLVTKDRDANVAFVPSRNLKLAKAQVCAADCRGPNSALPSEAMKSPP